MINQYTESFAIPQNGWTGGASGILITNSSVNAITADVRLWRDTNLSTISIRNGEILPLKVKYINYSGSGNTLIGFN
jgi:hypothetical protein